MISLIVSKIYKFKIENLDISVTVDNSFTANGPSAYAGYKNMHCHAQHELFFVFESPLLILNEQKPLEYKNCIVCIPPLFNHTTSRDNSYRLLVSYKENSSKQSDFSGFIDKFFLSDCPTTAKINDICTQYIKELEKLIFASDKLSSDMAASLLKLIFYNIYKTNADIKENIISKTYDSYLVTIDKVLSDYQRKIELQTIADELNLGTKQVSRIIRRYYKTSLAGLLIKKRLSVACSLLSNSNMTITDIAQYINFPSESYFYSQFKKVYKCTPLQYRKEKRLYNKCWGDQ